jgi:hypothetical protein
VGGFVSEKSSEVQEIGYHLSIQKQNILTGEVIQIASNLPKGSLSEDIRAEIEKITRAIDWRIPPADLASEQAALMKAGTPLDA